MSDAVKFANAVQKLAKLLRISADIIVDNKDLKKCLSMQVMFACGDGTCGTMMFYLGNGLVQRDTGADEDESDISPSNFDDVADKLEVIAELVYDMCV